MRAGDIKATGAAVLPGAGSVTARAGRVERDRGRAGGGTWPPTSRYRLPWGPPWSCSRHCVPRVGFAAGASIPDKPVPSFRSRPLAKP